MKNYDLDQILLEAEIAVERERNKPNHHGGISTSRYDKSTQGTMRMPAQLLVDLIYEVRSVQSLRDACERKDETISVVCAERDALRTKTQLHAISAARHGDKLREIVGRMTERDATRMEEWMKACPDEKGTFAFALNALALSLRDESKPMCKVGALDGVKSTESRWQGNCDCGYNHTVSMRRECTGHSRRCPRCNSLNEYYKVETLGDVWDPAVTINMRGDK